MALILICVLTFILFFTPFVIYSYYLNKPPKPVTKDRANYIGYSKVKNGKVLPFKRR